VPLFSRFYHMFRRSKSSNVKGRPQGGYILLTLLLVVALMAIFATAIGSRLEQQIKRDREEELIHRGVQYSRAVRRYYKKFGRYPTRIEDLESSNNLRFLRKRYKDPLNRDPRTGKERDFKLLHQGDVQMSFGAGGMQGGGAALNALAAQAGITPQNGQTIGNAVAAAAAAAQPSAPVNLNPSEDDSANQDPSKPGGQTGTGFSSGSASNGSSNQVFGGGPIVGVASANKDASIRSFNKKDHYNQWQFIYDPSSDRGGLLMTPNQPPLNVGTQPGAGQPGSGQPGIGQPGNGQQGPGMNGGMGGFGGQSTSGNPPQQQPQQQ
jgi:type II secretory pathway pseudopilin PulG